VAADAGQLRHRLALSASPLTAGDILRAARHLGLKARNVSSHWNRLDKTPLPALAQHRDGHWLLIASADAERVLVQDPLEARPLTLPRKLFEPAWQGTLILLTRRAQLADASTGFGFGWFVPALVKYRKLFGEVLVASFVLQLFGLITPLFFQVVIDKVLVHKGLTTLDVLAANW
jgi:subfamily B ATP-binding cassette protein HlyB/CyaB